MATPDKRFSPRLNARATDYVVYVEGSGKVQDVSLTGVFIVDPQPLPVGTMFGFTLSLGDQQIPIRGVVSRSVPGAGMGVRFQEMSLETRHRLERVINGLSSPRPARN